MENLLLLTRKTDEEHTSHCKEADKIDLLAAATDAFNISDQITGILSGGIEAPRIMLRAIAIKDCVLVNYTYQDGMYHDTRAGKEFQDVYILENDELSIKGKDTLFPIRKDDPFFELTKDEIADFCDEHGVRVKGL